MWDAGEVRIADKRYQYDARDRLENVSDSEDPAQNADYEFDANGNLVELSRDGKTTAFHYDSRNQLTLVNTADQDRQPLPLRSSGSQNAKADRR